MPSVQMRLVQTGVKLLDNFVAVKEAAVVGAKVLRYQGNEGQTDL